MRLTRLAAAALLAALLAGCATPPPASDKEATAEFRQTNDPLEPTNRVFYQVNDAIDTAVLRPVAIGYRDVVPQPVRDHVHNVLDNLGTPVTLANDMMEGKPRRAGDTLMRMLVNTTFGIAGIFDVATGWGWPAHDADFGITLGVWGIDSGPYLFLPILGPSNPRDAVGFGVDIALDPTTWVGSGDVVTGLSYGRIALGAIDARERLLDTLDKIKAQALDPYATIRSLARQHRRAQIEAVRKDTRATVPDWYPAAAAPTH
ncbi:MAG: VacJ family lipoprotein [Rhodospirillales bacterium]|nr:VacJ family lipoprotein [Rhodospirillales bacterium]MDE2200325.1 VacJ family lipoprotein [Rhodospirillales bacterium]MDE2576093.1 VacJ family lipoprotein [Rhodospirillales bacterium]